MKRRLRIVLVIAGLVSGAMGYAVAPDPPAEAATTCYASPSNATCDGVAVDQTFGVQSCGDDGYPVPRGNPDAKSYVDPNTGWDYVVSLWYSPRCSTNWSQVVAYGGGAFTSAQASTKVRRYAGPDGGYLMEHLPGSVDLYLGQSSVTFISPMVWSPHDKAQACLSLPPFSGNPDQIACTQEW